MQQPDGFGEFVAVRSPALLRTAWLLTGNWASAEDLVQVALAKTWRRWRRLAQPDLAEAYVRRVIVTSYATDRRRRWHGEVPTAELPDRASPADAYADSDWRAAVALALGDLPRRQRAVVVLCYFDDLTEAEAARQLGVAVGTVKSQKSKALARLRAHPALAEHPEEGVRP